MKNRAIVWTLFGVGLVLICSMVYFIGRAERREPSPAVNTDQKPDDTYCAEPNRVEIKTEPNEALAKTEPNEVTPKAASIKDAFQDEPEAHALYDKMIDTMRSAETLSYRGNCSASGMGPAYEIWMKKPNYFRVETVNMRGLDCGTLIGDGDNLWICWPKGNTPPNEMDDKIYMTKATRIGRHSIGHEVARLRAGIGMTIIDPSTFHGYTDSLQSYLDGVRSWEPESIEGNECDVIEASFMNRQRIWYIWLSKLDHLPRKIKEVVRISRPLIGYEHWSDVTINEKIPDEIFVWTPPAGWVQWTPPEPDLELLKPGDEAPDFELLLADETKARLSGYRGKIVWFYMWRVG